MSPTTPPPPSPSSLRTPPAPLHGPMFDNYEPWAPHKSGRPSVQRNQHRARTTPPPHDANDPESNLSTPPAGRRATRNRTTSSNLSPPSSAQSSPQKRTARPKAVEERNVSGASNDDSNASASVPLGIPADGSGVNSGKSTGKDSVFGHGMLPTPAKTPKKRRGQPVAGLGSTARVLFPARPQTIEEAMPSPKKGKRGKKYIGFSLNSFSEDPNGDEEERKIEIYTDSKERVPELDIGDDNPFIDRPGQAAAAEEARSLRKRRTARTDVSNEVEESLERGDGMYYVFRGKKVYRKFDGPSVEDGTSPGSPSRTRSSIKPRLLFPTKEQVQARETRNQEKMADEGQYMAGENEVDEEAVTDIDEKRITKSQEILETEDSEMTDVLDVEAGSETEVETEPATPDRKTKVDPFSSPPASGTRSMTRGGVRKASPIGSQSIHMTRSRGTAFNGWKRTKGGSSSGRVRKREGEAAGQSVSKRTRSASGV